VRGGFLFPPRGVGLGRGKREEGRGKREEARAEGAEVILVPSSRERGRMDGGWRIQKIHIYPIIYPFHAFSAPKK